VILALLVVLLVPAPASTHHILGIPHYAYSDEYPQVPFVEVIAQVGTHDLDFTWYPGIPDPGDRLRFKLYVLDRVTGEPYREPLRVEIVRKRFFGGAEAVAQPFEIRTGVGPEANDYKFFHTFDAAEAYEVRVHMPDGERIEMVPFPVTIGRTDDRPLLYGAAGILILAVAVVAVIKRRQRATGRSLRPREATP